MTPDYKALLKYARTPSQAKVIETIIPLVVEGQRGEVSAAARALKLTREAVKAHVAAVRRHAARAGYAPDNSPPWSQEIPEGHEVKGMSTLVNAQGEREHQWAKTQRAPDPDAMKPVVPEGHHITATSTMIDREGRPIIQWMRAEPAEAAREKAFLEHARAACAEFVPMPLITGPQGQYRK